MKHREQIKVAFKEAFPLTVPVLVGFLVLGTAYGVLMSSKGYAPIFSILMSLIAFGGSMQYVAITLLVSSFQPFYALFLSFLVNARHIFYGLSMLEKYRDMKRAKPFLIFTLCDETFSVVCNVTPKEGTNRTMFYVFISLLNYLYWAIGTAIGAIIGKYINFDTKGLDFALTALFVVIFLDQWKTKENRRPAMIGVVSSVICLLLVNETFFILAAMVLIVVVTLASRTQMDKSKEEEGEIS